jgi:hypothetical protein
MMPDAPVVPEVPASAEAPARRYTLGSGLPGDTLATLMAGRASGNQALLDKTARPLREASTAAGRHRELNPNYSRTRTRLAWLPAPGGHR